MGMYINQDPIGLEGNNPNIYAYVHDANGWIDPFGLTNEEFTVGLHKDLKKPGNKASTDLRSHHVGQKTIMKDLVANYDLENAPVILVNKYGHNNRKGDLGVVSRSKINPKTGKPFDNVRDLIARDIRELRRVYPDIPNSKLKELIDLNKSMYPEMNVKKKKKISH